VVGAVGVLRGGPAMFAGRRGFFALEGIVEGMGNEVVSIGMPGMNTGSDLDGDGYADLLINDPYWFEPVQGERQKRGRLWMVRGSPVLPGRRAIQNAAHLVFLADTSVPGLFGYQWNTGDFDGDGRTDVVVSDHYLGDGARHDFPGGSYLFLNGVHFGG
jgi:hypothetical protein